MNYCILGGGLSGLTVAYLLQNLYDIEKITIIEKEQRAGGLCRSFSAQGIVYDIGPHIFFSKNQRALAFLLNMLGDNVVKLRRSNRIMHNTKLIQFPFENDLSGLSPSDKNYCVKCFFENPYENYQPSNMLQFFLKTFGEGITSLYLRPYNEKIWKFDPAFMDTQMVERIPKPTKDEILRSANGETVDGYVHQLYFSYPKNSGTESLIAALVNKFNEKVQICTEQSVLSVTKKGANDFEVLTTNNKFSCNKLVSTIPTNEFVKIYNPHVTDEVSCAAESLRYNSIIIGVANVAFDYSGDNFAFMTANKQIVFHRISKLDYLGNGYSIDGTTSYMIEVTYRKGDVIDGTSDEDVIAQVKQGLLDIQFVKNLGEINFVEIKRFEYAYVIYDLNHRENMDRILNYFKIEGVDLLGRFGSFEYLNMDAVVDQAQWFVEHLIKDHNYS